MNRTRKLLTLAPFRRLQWKLTFSYLWVTVGTLLALMVVFGLFTVITVIRLLGSDILSDMVIDSLRTDVTPNARPYLEEEPVDVVALQRWASTSLINSQTAISLTAPPRQQQELLIGDNLRLDDGYSILVIVGPDGETLAVVPEPINPADQSYLADRLEEGRVVLGNALAGAQDNEALRARFANGQNFVAVPILGYTGKVIGGIAVSYRMPSFAEFDIWLPFLQSLLILAIPITIMAAFIGAIFGFLTSRGMTKRIQRIAIAADAWSQGDFSVVDQDKSGDELGQLSRRLNLMAEQLQNLLDTREELATVEERNRLARDLHDSVKQQVFATTMQLGAAKALMQTDPDSALGHITEAEKLAKQSQQELSILIQELRPAALEDKGLVEALRIYMADWSQQTKISGQVRVQNEKTLSLELEQTLFRVAQEALSNVARHSQAQSVDIHLAWEIETIILTIQDDGLGLPAGVSPGVGLQSMRERVERLNGRFQLDSHLNEGVTITAVIPLK